MKSRFSGIITTIILIFVAFVVFLQLNYHENRKAECRPVIVINKSSREIDCYFSMGRKVETSKIAPNEICKICRFQLCSFTFCHIELKNGSRTLASLGLDRGIPWANQPYYIIIPEEKYWKND